MFNELRRYQSLQYSFEQIYNRKGGATNSHSNDSHVEILGTLSPNAYSLNKIEDLTRVVISYEIY